MDISKKKELSAMISSKTKQKNNLLSREKEKWMETHDIDMYIEKFKKQIKSGPFYICCVCNRMLYKKSVVYGGPQVSHKTFFHTTKLLFITTSLSF
jgi:hypothetical protein